MSVMPLELPRLRAMASTPDPATSLVADPWRPFDNNHA